MAENSQGSMQRVALTQHAGPALRDAASLRHGQTQTVETLGLGLVLPQCSKSAPLSRWPGVGKANQGFESLEPQGPLVVGPRFLKTIGHSQF